MGPCNSPQGQKRSRRAAGSCRDAVGAPFLLQRNPEQLLGCSTNSYAKTIRYVPAACLRNDRAGQRSFPAFAQRQPLASHFASVGEARGKASGGGTVPGGETGAAREPANLRFGKAHIEERRKDLMLGGGAMAGAKIERVVSVHAIGDGGKAARTGQFIQYREKLVLAEIAAVGLVRAVGGVFHLVRLDKLVAQRQLFCKLLDHFSVVRGKTRRKSGDRQGPLAKSTVRGPCQIGRIRASRKRHDERRDPREARQEKLLFLFRGKSRLLSITDLNESFHIKGEYIAECVFRHKVIRRAPESLEVQKHVDRSGARIGFEPVANAFIVERQLAEDLFLMQLQFRQNLFVFRLVEDLTLRDGPRGMQLFFSGRREAGQHHFAEPILRAFVNGDGIRNRVRRFVKGGNRVDLRVEVAVTAKFFAYAVPPRFDLHAIGDI